ncbi:hypothetical protein CGLO_14629 [Colletotrichum gloeosporioides Cg-14]|uniref:Uncharacterized protein n=1 Tax=Colletotrichum gloeosporioides (strain Cg-14) TaxID=1237896 RepID=T0JT84_COLGC|nr:hypothetical protein CGLO_14629 [Colletotrichum gloeosporioides Cg-14]
MDKLSNAAHG